MKSVQFATVSSKGGIVIPKLIREQFGFKPGDEVAFVVVGESISLLPVPPGDPIEWGRGLLGTSGPSITERLLADRRWELDQEERDLSPPRRHDRGSPGRRLADREGRYGTSESAESSDE